MTSQEKKALTKKGKAAARLENEARDVYFLTYGAKDDPNYFSGNYAKYKKSAQKSSLRKLSEKDLMKVYEKARKTNLSAYKKVYGGK